MVVGVKVCELTDGFSWFVCGLYVGILMSPLTKIHDPVFFTYNLSKSWIWRGGNKNMIQSSFSCYNY